MGRALQKTRVGQMWTSILACHVSENQIAVICKLVNDDSENLRVY